MFKGLYWSPSRRCELTESMLRDLYDTARCMEYNCMIYVDNVIKFGVNGAVIDVVQNITEKLEFIVDMGEVGTGQEITLLNKNYAENAIAYTISGSDNTLYLAPNSKKSESVDANTVITLGIRKYPVGDTTVDVTYSKSITEKNYVLDFY